MRSIFSIFTPRVVAWNLHTTSLYSEERFESCTLYTVMSALGIFAQCLGRGIPEDGNGY